MRFLSILLALLPISAFCQPVGETVTYGNTFYDLQHNGSIGKMVALDPEGGRHFVYTRGTEQARQVYYNYLSPEGEWLSEPFNPTGRVSVGSHSGFCSIDLIEGIDQEVIPAIFYNVAGHLENNPMANGTAQTILINSGSHSYPESPEGEAFLWPKGVIDRNHNSHILAVSFGDGDLVGRIGYWRGEPDGNLESWDFQFPPDIVDSTRVISIAGAASPTSSRVAFAWHHNRALVEWWDGNAPGTAQLNNDIRYIIIEEGEEPDWERDTRSITRIIPPRPEFAELDLQEAYGDTFRPFCDVDIQFDPWGDDNLYGAFATRGFWESPDPDGEPFISMTVEQGHLWFWNEEQDTITLVYDGWYYNRTDNGGSWHTRCGSWRTNADRPSIAFDPEEEGKIYLVWANFPKITEMDDEGNCRYLEGAGDTSSTGFVNAEVMVSISTDYGITWREPINITRTCWPDDAGRAPEPGECLSENEPSVAVEVNDALHITYVVDLEAGSSIRDLGGNVTNNPVVYHRVPLEELELHDPIRLPREGFMFHNYIPLDVVHEPGLNAPTAFSLSAFPNPFNSMTTIRYSTGSAARPTRLAVYDINGRLVADLFGSTGVSAGRANHPAAEGGATTHSVVWNADGLPGGIYLIRLESGNEVKTIKTLLMK